MHVLSPKRIKKKKDTFHVHSMYKTIFNKTFIGVQACVLFPTITFFSSFY